MGRARPESSALTRAVRMGVVPAGIYLVVFVIVTWPLAAEFSTHLYADARDGLVMAWGVWWTKTAVLHAQSPWFTKEIFFPYGVSLVPHTLVPFAGFLAVLLPFLTLTQTYNFMVIFGFVSGGVAAFLLAHAVSRAFWPSIAAGFVFSFSNYHFAHMAGHLNLVLLFGIPLFVLCMRNLVVTPGHRNAIATALALLLVVLCDYYYFFYCALAAVLVAAWLLLRRRSVRPLWTGPHRWPLVTFAAATLATSGVMMLRLLRESRADAFTGVHDPDAFSADLLSPFVYGASLRFSGWTESVWSRYAGNTSETSVYIGVSVIALLVVAWKERRRIRDAHMGLLFFAMAFFLVCSFGPTLHVAGRPVAWVPMPYRALEIVFPPLEFSGAPSRMMVMVMLSASVICALALKRLFEDSRRGRVFAAVLLALMFVEFLPRTVRPFDARMPAYVQQLRDLPDGAVIDGGAPDTYHAMFYQTAHGKPIAGGKVARLPRTLHQNTGPIVVATRQGDWERLYREFGFRYFVAPNGEIRDLSRGGRPIRSRTR